MVVHDVVMVSRDTVSVTAAMALYNITLLHTYQSTTDYTYLKPMLHVVGTNIPGAILIHRNTKLIDNVPGFFVFT